MTHTPAPPYRKPSRLGLYIPFILLAMAAAGWSGAWVWLKGEVVRRMDTGAAALRGHGWQVAWDGRQVGGYPFRIDVDFTNLRVADPSGLGLTASTLKTEAEAYAPTHWVMVAPAGVTLTRANDGPVYVGARVLRASLSAIDQHPPRIAIEGQGLTFTPAPGAGPFALATAQGLQIDTRAGPDDQGALFASLDQATAGPETLMGKLIGPASLNLKLEGVFSHASQLRGGGWPAAVRGWTTAGGILAIKQMTAQGGGALVDARTGSLMVDSGGRLSGAMMAALGKDTDAPMVTIGFRGGRVTLDGVDLGPSPRVF
jgi:hypothetical protein